MTLAKLQTFYESLNIENGYFKGKEYLDRCTWEKMFVCLKKVFFWSFHFKSSQTKTSMLGSKTSFRNGKEFSNENL